MEALDVVVFLLSIQCILFSLLIFQGRIASTFGIGMKSYETSLASNVASLVSTIIEEPDTDAATTLLLEKALGSRKTQDAVVLFLQSVVGQVLQSVVKSMEEISEDEAMSPGEEGAMGAAEQASQKRSRQPGQSQDAQPGLAELIPISQSVKRLTDCSVEKIRAVAAAECGDPATADAVIKLAMSVLQDERVEQCMVTMLSNVLSRPEVTQSISNSITGVGTAMARRIVVNPFASRGGG